MTRQEKIKELLDDCISKMSDDDKLIYRPIVEYVLELGYTPKPVKTAGSISDELAFSKSKVKRTLLRMNPNHKGTGKTVFRCGGELIRIPAISAEDVDEVKMLMKTQDEFWMKKITQ